MAPGQPGRRLGNARTGHQRGHRERLKPWGRIKARGDRRTLLCDYDQERPPTLGRIWRLLGRWKLPPRYIAYDRTARGWHVRIGLPIALTSGELVAAQALLGSDPKRERYNLARVICGARPRDWNLLFSRKYE